MDKKELIKRYNEFLKKENLTNQEAWVGSGGTLLLLGIREETNDIDLGVSKDKFKEIRSRNQYKEKTLDDGTVVVAYDSHIDLHLDHGYEEHTVIDDIGSWTIEEVIKLKERLNRPKDQIDLKDIKEYLSREQIDSYLKIQTNLVRRNATILSHKDLGQEYMLHISHKNMEGEKYQPWIGARQGITEDRTVPRITVAPYLIGCIHGYAEALYSFIEQGNKGIFYIHKIPFTHCLKPTTRLVYDADLTDEHWLVRYNKETTFYYPKLVGKFIVSGVQLDPSGKTNKFNLNLVLDKITEEFLILPGVACKQERSELEFPYDTCTADILANKSYRLKKSDSNLSLESYSNRSSIISNW